MNTKLSVSSVILAAVLSGCSQQVTGGSQIANGSSQSSGSQQVSGGSQVSSSQQSAGGSQVSGSQQSGSQQQVETAVPAVAPTITQPRVINSAPVRSAPARFYKRQVPQPRRVYTRGPKPRSNGLGLPAAQPGQCFAKVQVPAKYQNKTRRVLIQKAMSKRVLVRAPQYRWVNKKVQTRKAYYQTRTIPAQYKTVTQRVLVKPAYNTWQKGHGAITRIDKMTGEIMCRVQIPAVYKNVSRRVLVRPAQKARTLVPATYKTVKQKQFIAPALYRTVHTPARYKTVNYRVKTSNARYVWRGILCQTNAPKHYKKQSYRKAPKQYRRAAVRRVARSAPKRQQYRKSSGIDYQAYLAVMNAGSSKTKVSSAKKVSKKAVHKKSKIKKMKSSAPKMTTPKMTTPKKVTAAPKEMTKKVTEQAPQAKAKQAQQEAPPIKQAQESKQATKQSIVSGIQKALKAKGFDPGSMDGKMGPGTAAALKAFQKSRGLPVGQLNKDTFRALGLIR